MTCVVSLAPAPSLNYVKFLGRAGILLPTAVQSPAMTAGIGRALLRVLVLFLPCAAFAAPGDVLFSDNFERANLAPWTTTNNSRSGILTGGQVSNSPNRGAYTRRQVVTVTSPAFNAAVPGAEIAIWVRHGSDAFSEYPDGGEDLAIEYRRANNSWAQLLFYNGGGTAGQTFNDVVTLPPDALHGNLAIRARQTGGSGTDYDYWHFDDVIVTERAAPPPIAIGSCDDFEGGLSGNWLINPTTGFAGASAATSQSPVSSMFLNGGVVAVNSIPLDTSDPYFTNLTMWIRRGSDTFSEDPDTGENLVVEYLDDVGGWIPLETFAGNGGAGQVYVRSYNLPAAGRHGAMQLRFRMTGGSGAGWDFWHIDDVCFDQEFVPILVVAKNAATISDPANGTTNPKSIPGSVSRYTLEVTNQGLGTVDVDTLAISDIIAAGASMIVDTSGGDPVRFTDGAVSSGLSFTYATDVSYSSQPGGGAPFNYIPVPDPDGVDPAVTGFRVNPTGGMNAASGPSTPSFLLEFEVRIQ